MGVVAVRSPRRTNLLLFYAGTEDGLERLRSSLGIGAVVLHDPEKAVAATRQGATTVSMLEAGEPVRTTGASRFSGGLARGRARGWSWDAALALGNACAARFVATAKTGDAPTLRAFVEAWR